MTVNSLMVFSCLWKCGFVDVFHATDEEVVSLTESEIETMAGVDTGNLQAVTARYVDVFEGDRIAVHSIKCRLLLRTGTLYLQLIG